MDPWDIVDQCQIFEVLLQRQRFPLKDAESIVGPLKVLHSGQLDVVGFSLVSNEV